MTSLPPDGSRDRRIEAWSNLWLIHPAARALLPRALRMRLSANAVSILGLIVGILAALCYARWQHPLAAIAGLALSVAWLIADGLDGMIARATQTASALGRMLDGLCDHGVFILIYVAMALSIGTVEGWALAVTAGAAHMVQSSLYEGERGRFHRRAKGVALIATPITGNALVRFYDYVAGVPDRAGARFERLLARSDDPIALGERYADAAVAPMRFMTMLSANTRVWTICVACLLGNPRIFWWVEIAPMTIVSIVGLLWHRRVEHGFTDGSPFHSGTSDDRFAPAFAKEQGR
ncbi:CDP-alcohol phosphatidyltransferase family protein [Sphingomonas bacterium]|uniref:CDP-alcohol phosphatidyltransferase family protein n=1 Tax=Sphingomonas bacterium TaxID=1895847 RepID=UPI0015776726|nr:CDP-alcohol phosphatidyltransferase family protein [Sphingomonas bacterium]